ncbi:uncharacterized protein FIESC28_07649 [Fusarium coffeatum]|uniref:Uncharacterized protein n=1 Tax=Fusarium coffeatum TaxID=231269 RepID=A0A366RDZ0_9HYPO|nr:uncharacterized protein FIESC28_07649 [Fusarium coffeatum]RBR14520.1 hypothetical protein FIESC28_07649 [Fusarium coffeatum]
MTKSHCFCAICGAPTGRLEWNASSADTYSPHLVKPSTVEWLADVGLIIYNTKGGLPTMSLSYEHEDARHSRLTEGTTDRFKNTRKLPVEDDKTYDAIPIARLQNGGFWNAKKGSEYAVLSPDKIEDVDKLVGKLIELAKVGWPSSESQPLTPELLKHHRTWLEKFNDDLPWAKKFLYRPINGVNWERLYKTFKNSEYGRAEWNMPAIPALQNRARIWKICNKIMEEHMPHLEARRDQNDVHRKSVIAQNGDGNNKLPPELYDATPAAKWENANFTYYGSLAECEPVITAHWSGGSDSTLGRLGVTMSEDRDQKEKIMGPHAVPFDSPINNGRHYNNGRYFRTECFAIPKGTWIREVVVYTKLTIPYEEGYSHKTKIKGLKLVLTNGQSAELGRCHSFTPEVYKAPPGHFMAGVSPISKTPPGSHARFVDRGCTPPKPIPGLQAYIDVEKRPNHLALEPNAQPAMQHLILAKREFDLDCLESFGVDTHLGGFELNLYGLKRIVIGPRRRTMKYLAFEGKTDKDDWIIGCWVHKSNGKPVGLRFFTRKGRQLIAGEPGTDGEPHLIGNELERWAPAKSFISELSAAWSYTESGKPQMTAFGAALGNDLPNSCLVENLVPSSCVELNLADGPEKDVYLDSTSSPLCIPHIVNSRGPQTVFGRERSSYELFHRNGRRRSDRRIVSYLDLSGPIRTVKATFCHTPKSGQLPLVAMFVDRKNHPREKRDRHGTTKLGESSFGPTLFDKEELCECKNFPELYDPQTTDCVHYSETEWNFGGREIQSIRIWLTDDNILAGLQSVAVGDQKGPVWATGLKDKGTKFVQVNRLPSPERKEAGLVLFLDSNESPSAYDDIVVVGIRPIGFSVDAPLIRRDN